MAVAGMTAGAAAEPALTRSEKTTSRSVTGSRAAHRPELEAEILTPGRPALDRAPGPGDGPAERQVVRHADRERPVLGKEKIGRAGMGREQGVRLRGRGDPLHRREGAEFVVRLDLDDGGAGEGLGGEGGELVGREPVGEEPGRVGRLRRRVVFDVRIVLAAFGLVGHVIEIVLAGHGARLEDEVAGFAVDGESEDVGDALARGCVDDDDGLLPGFRVAAPPGDADPDGRWHGGRGDRRRLDRSAPLALGAALAAGGPRRGRRPGDCPNPTLGVPAPEAVLDVSP